MATPGRPWQSGIPASGRSSGIPTPGRPRSSSNVYQRTNTTDADDISRAFADAIKANDPAQHKAIPNLSIMNSLSPETGAAPSLSGRRSATGHPPSATSVSYVSYERSKTPTSARPLSRPPSRHSDVFSKTIPSRPFEVGDNVRIESLGFEGTLRYIGDIDGKTGLWAGVELRGGFSGKGKNNGSVNGKQYFKCPEKCGVFVATTKLSAPTVGPGAISRPSSVASSRGRMTPSLTGRITPSFSSSTSRSSLNGRVTPSSGRVTPSTSTSRISSAITPAGGRIRSISKPSAAMSTSPTLTSKITAGSRASKYVSMTAKQLSAREWDGENISEQRHGTRMSPSPSYSSLTLSSPTRSTTSPFSTPKPGIANRVPSNMGSLSSSPAGKVRPSASTPRARVPSSVAMPPPASPISAVSRSVLSAEPLHKREDGVLPLTDLQINGKMLQERISHLVSSSRDSPSRPQSSSSISSGSEDRELVEQLQSRLQALEYENDRLRLANTNETPDVAAAQASQFRMELDGANVRISELSRQLLEKEETIIVRDTKIASLEQERVELSSSLGAEISNKKCEIQTLHKKLEENDDIILKLQATVQSSEASIIDRDALLETKEAEFNALQSRLNELRSNYEEERRELNSQIDELRVAGQETIALYEERLSKADAQRYDLEMRLSILEGAQAPDRTQSPRSSGYSASAQEIDNETLRDQVVHLQKKIATMEDVLEDVRITAEREEAALRDKMKRLKDKEDVMKKELNEGKKEVELMTKSEATAKNRVEEVEEALRESTVALENARAEVESLRAELANLDGLIGDGTGDLSSKVTALVQRSITDKARFEDKVARLEHKLEELQDYQGGKTAQLVGEDLTRLQELQDTVSGLTNINEELAEKNGDLQERLKETQRDLEDTAEELGGLKKHISCSPAVTNGMQGVLKLSQSKQESSLPAREEITGLKHIVQELQKENLTQVQRIKLLESENQLLSSEMDQLRQEVKILEENLEHNLSQEEVAEHIPLAFHGGPGSSEQQLQEQKSRFEVELEQLRKRLADAEMKHARTVHDLNKEIGELEALVESKIYREDELEQEIEHLKEKLARQKKSSKSSGDIGDSGQRLNAEPSVTVGLDLAGPVCEICERPGHDIFNCDLLKDDSAVGSAESKTAGGKGELFCEDCESHGHVAVDCPRSLDVF